MVDVSAGTLRVRGGRVLRGRVRVHAAKNAVLPMMATCLLTGEATRLRNVPLLGDVQSMRDLLQSLGAAVAVGADGSWLLHAGDRLQTHAPAGLVGGLRASVLILGPLVSRLGHARLSLPGGCAIGTRSIDLHLKGLVAMGAEVRSAPDHVDVAAPRGLHGASVRLDFPSVTATENLLLAACLARGETVIENAAAEPEITDLAACLNAMGARVRGAGTAVVCVEGRSELGGADHTPIPDRIEAGTLLIAAAMTGGEAVVEGVVAEHLAALMAKLRQAGAEIWSERGALYVNGQRRMRAVDVTTGPHPGFATDLQPLFCALLAVADGASVVTETIFDDRLRFTEVLRKMGADVRLEGRSAFIRGVRRLRAAPGVIPDLRGGAAMVLAALVAEGETELTGVRQIDRGYVDLAASLQSLGADLERACEPAAAVSRARQERVLAAAWSRQPQAPPQAALSPVGPSARLRPRSRTVRVWPWRQRSRLWRPVRVLPRSPWLRLPPRASLASAVAAIQTRPRS